MKRIKWIKYAACLKKICRAMSNAEAKQARQEIDELLTSGRFERLETVSTHIFQMFGREWKEITRRNVLLHMFHDSIDDMTKLLARDCFEYGPIWQVWRVGHGSRAAEPDLDRLRFVARHGQPCQIEPYSQVDVAEMGTLNISSQSSSPRAAFPHTHSTLRRSFNHSTSGYSSLLLPPPPPATCECAPSPYRQCQPTWDIHARMPIGDEAVTTSPYMPSHESTCQDDLLYDYSFHENCVPLPRYDAPDLSKPRTDDYASLEANNSPEDKVTMAERRVRALMDSIQPVGSFWESPPKVRDKVDSPRASSRTENPAGVIGSPVKGKGGASSARRQTPNKAWKW